MFIRRRGCLRKYLPWTRDESGVDYQKMHEKQTRSSHKAKLHDFLKLLSLLSRFQLPSSSWIFLKIRNPKRTRSGGRRLWQRVAQTQESESNSIRIQG